MSSNRPIDDLDETVAVPVQIGRYRIEKPIGKGGFGSVYLAYDKELERKVAIKVPHHSLVKGQIGAREYLQEARMVANLDHPNIVPVYDVGTSAEFECYVVSKFIPGQDLGKVLREHRFNCLEAVEVVASIAEALHHAHKQGIVHRDVKPSNILIDLDGKPYLADFGLALPESRLGAGPRYAGTPAYMSPEQARGEGHRVDGRSDIFSLGAVLYELVTGKRAFRGETKAELMEVVENFEPRPLRQYDEDLPKELERICQKALSKRASERYPTAHDFAAELRSFLQLQNPVGQPSNSSSTFKLGSSLEQQAREIGERTTPNSGKTPTEPGSVSQASASNVILVIPKGLRSFDAHDSDFFIELLPGPRGREGLPENLRFWKDRIEAMDADESCSVGLLYGPSGCGKSSFVKAGLLPRLASHVVPIFIESSEEFTEKKLEQALKKTFPEINPELDLPDTIATIRRGGGPPQGKKVLLIFDQFEQWLHAKRAVANNELFKALRQCDGERVQAILLVRADFWMAVTWFLKDLEIDLVQGKNFAAIDLFPQHHAEKVLIAFGRAYGTLPPQGKLDSDQRKFIEESVDGLAQDGKVMCVRLAVYAEMMKNKPWKASSLKQIGGTEGVGVSFLEESFGAQANPRIRLHQMAARAVLKSLLPEAGTMINVQLKSYEQLFQASGYSDYKQFDDLIRVLDGELRLISPTDPKGMSQEIGNESSEGIHADPKQKYYRLAHDYLITALRNWLSRKKRETRRGRAELLLEEQSGFWNTKRTNRYLPSLLEHLRIRLLTSPNQWGDGEIAMMRAAAKFHGFWVGVSVCSIALIVAGAVGIRGAIRSENQRLANVRLNERYAAESSRLVDALLKADTARVADVVGELHNYRTWANEKLRQAFLDHADGSEEKLHAAMALVKESPECVEYLAAQLPLVDAEQFLPICESLKGNLSQLPTDYLKIANDLKLPNRERLQAACAIAQVDSSNPVWQNSVFCRFVAESLTRLYPSELAPLRQALRPVAPSIIPNLNEIFLDRDPKVQQQQRLFATESLVDYQQNNPDKLFDLLLDCDEMQYPLVIHALNGKDSSVIEMAKSEISRTLPADATEGDKDILAIHQSNAAVALYQLKQYDLVWASMEGVEDPRLRSFIVHWLKDRGCSPLPLLEKISTEEDHTRLQAMVLALGEFASDAFDTPSLKLAIDRLEKILKEAPSSDLRAAAIWSLRSLGHGELVERIVAEQFQSQLSRYQPWLKKFEAAKQESQRLRKSLLDSQEANKAEWIAKIISANKSFDFPTSVFAHLASLSEITPAQPNQQNSVDVVEGPFGDALRFDGHSSSKLSSGNDEAISGAFSYGCWFLTDDSAQYGCLFSRMDLANYLRGFDLWIEHGRITAHLKNRYIDKAPSGNRFIKMVTQNVIGDGKWHHALVSYDGSKDARGVAIYIDGKLSDVVILSNSMETDLTTDAPLLIGCRPNGFEFRGSLSNLRIWKKALNADEAEGSYFADLRALAIKDPKVLNATQSSVLDQAFLAHDTKIHATESNWNQIENDYVSELMSSQSDWFYTTQGHWMIRVNAGQFRMGFPATERDLSGAGLQHTRTIARIYAMSAHEVNVGQWREFQKDNPPAELSREKYKNLPDKAPDLPVLKINWFEAAQYCNWLNEREGIPENQWCYIPHPEKGYAPGMQVKPSFWKLTGYRLPTEPEWEFACRGGSMASRCYGANELLLGKYAWYQFNSNDHAGAVGVLKPNQFGFFDMHGNASEWCFDSFDNYHYKTTDAVDHPFFVSPLTTAQRTLRGGGYYDLPKYVRSSHRYGFDPTYFTDITGLRIARTLNDFSKD